MELPRCKRCIYLDIKPPGIARENSLCRWCISMGKEDNRIRREKGMKFYPEQAEILQTPKEKIYEG